MPSYFSSLYFKVTFSIAVSIASGSIGRAWFPAGHSKLYGPASCSTSLSGQSWALHIGQVEWEPEGEGGRKDCWDFRGGRWELERATEALPMVLTLLVWLPGWRNPLSEGFVGFEGGS